jgi:hypothetical protein
MTTWQGPDPEPQQPPPSQDDEGTPSPFERPPFDRDPEAQHAPGDSEGTEPGSTPPPMQAARGGTGGEEIAMDATGAEREPVGNDNIREGRVGGVMGPAHQTMGQGQGG